LANIKANDELADALAFIEHAKACALQAGGEAPAPLSPAMLEITVLEGYSGNDLLMALYDQRDVLLTRS